MSEAGMCIRALSAQYLGMKPEERPAYLDIAAEEGKWHEQRVKDKLRTEGYEVEECRLCPVCHVAREGIHVEMRFNNFLLVGHLDGKVNHNNLKGKHILEVKSKSQYEFDRWMRGQFKEFQEEADQIACYMAASPEKTVMFCVKNRNSGYLDRNFYRYDDVAFDNWTFAERFIMIVDKFDMLIAHLGKKELVPAVCDLSTLRCRRCFYKYLCIKPAEMTLQEEAVLHQAAETWRKGKLLEFESKKLLADSKDIFEQHILAAKQQNMSFEEIVISRVHVKEYDVPARTQKAYDYTLLTDKRKGEEQ